ncbi:MAG: DUF4878 domain-containing protein [Bacteroidales bacterium]|jgi:outer membrane lipoprotein-sorting protein|nr:DUF4878 domain-containing protein [Bacteroidales bacterium]
MKKIRLILMCVVALLFVSCGTQSNPEKTVKAFYNALYEKDYATASSYILTTDSGQQKQVAESLKETFKGDNALVSFHVFGSAKQTNDAAEVAVSTEISKPAKGQDAKSVATLLLVKSDGKWYISF